MLRKAAVLTALLLSVCVQAALGPGAEVPVSAPAYAALPLRETVRAVATDGTDFLTLWRDETPGRGGIYATVVGEHRASRPGIFLSPLPEPLVVRAVWTGNHYLVALTPYLEPTLLLKLNRDGEVIAPAQTLLLGGDSGIGAWAWNGSRVLAIAQGTNGSQGVLLDADGNVVRAGIALPEGVWYFDVHAAGDAFILTWIDRVAETPFTTQARAVRISASGEVGAPVVLHGPVHGWVAVSAASDGQKVAVVVRTGDTSNSVIRRYTIDGDLHVQAEAPLALAPNLGSEVSIVATSRGFVVGYRQATDDDLHTIAFGSTTVGIIDLPPLPETSLGLASNGSAVIGIFGRSTVTFDASLQSVRRAATDIAIAPMRQDEPVLATAGDRGLAVRNEYGTLRAQLVDANGQPLSPAPLTVATSVTWRAAAVFTGEVWLVAYTQPADFKTVTKVQRISAAGELLGAPIDLNLQGGDVALASNGTTTALLVADGFRRNWIRLVRFARSGDRIDATPIAITEERSADHPDIATNGEGFLVVWSHSPGYTPRVVGKRLDASGNPIDAEPVVIASGTGFAHSAAKIASDGEDYVVAYAQYGEYVIRDPPYPDDPRPAPARVFTKRVLSTGVLADVTADQEGSLLGFGTYPAITHDGTRYVLTFVKDVPDALWLFVSTLDAKGAPVSVPRQLVRAESYEPRHDIAVIGGRLWSAYSRVVAELEGVQRVFLREVIEQTGKRRGARN